MFVDYIRIDTARNTQSVIICPIPYNRMIPTDLKSKSRTNTYNILNLPPIEIGGQASAHSTEL